MGYESRYAIDSFGNIYSFPNKNHKAIKGLKPKITKKGYAIVALCNENGIKYKTIHRIMAETFLKDCDSFVVNHINGVKTDNRLSNLELVTNANNALHKIHVLRTGKAKLNYEQTEEIKLRVLHGEKQKDLAKEFCVSPQIINQVVKGTTYKKSCISLQYKEKH